MASVGAPLSVADITKQAENFEYDAKIKLRHWLRSADIMQKEAQIYEAEGNDAQTYLLLFRHAQLVLTHLASHPERTLPENKRAWSAANAAVANDLAKLEVIRPRIAKRHEEYLARRKAQQQALEALEGRSAAQRPDTVPKHVLRQSYEKATLDGGKHTLLAAKLAQREVRRRDIARRSMYQSGAEAPQGADRRSGRLWEEWDRQIQRDTDDTDDDLSRQLQEVARLQNGYRPSDHSRPSSSGHTTSPYYYPSVPHKSPQPLDQWSSFDSPRPTLPAAPERPPKEFINRPRISAPQPPPPLPPKTPAADPLFENPRPPPVPGKNTAATPPQPPIPGKYTESTTSTPSPSTSDSENLDEFAFKPSAYLENGSPLRTIFLPNQLRQRFLTAASSNTRLNLETCGILCGILKSNALFITRLLIPEQTSTSDTCETLNEQDYFDYCDKEELMVLGWIHTHPTQTCFMSSRDLHTHVGYQVMMPESIAIVCAPSKHPSWGVFRLTDPPGKQAILNCTQPGIFHPHTVDDIYTEAMRPGHVVELGQAPLEVVDMRPKK